MCVSEREIERERDQLQALVQFLVAELQDVVFIVCLNRMYVALNISMCLEWVISDAASVTIDTLVERKRGNTYFGQEHWLNYHDFERRVLLKLFNICRLSHIVTITLKICELYNPARCVRNHNNNNTNSDVKTATIIIIIHFFIYILI